MCTVQDRRCKYYSMNQTYYTDDQLSIVKWPEDQYCDADISMSMNLSDCCCALYDRSDSLSCTVLVLYVIQHRSKLYYIDDQLSIVKWPEDQCSGADKCDIQMNKNVTPPPHIFLNIFIYTHRLCMCL